MKKIIYTAVCLAAVFTLFGCASAGTDKSDNKPAQNEQNKTDEMNSYLEEIKDYFPTDGLYRLYHGYAESGFEVRYDDFEENEDMAVFKYLGAMNDERGFDGDERTFIVSYTIADDKIIEHTENNDSLSENKNTVYSKIKDFVVLSGSIAEGNSWQQEAELDGKTVTVTTTVTEADEDGFKTVSQAAAEGYKDGMYTEERTYKKGEGLVSFSNTPYGSDEDDTLIFGYGFSVANKESVTGKIPVLE